MEGELAKGTWILVASTLGPVVLQSDSNTWVFKYLSNHFKDISVSEISGLAIPQPSHHTPYCSHRWDSHWNAIYYYLGESTGLYKKQPTDIS